MTESFRSGDVVELRSGGPRMTVLRMLQESQEPVRTRLDEMLQRQVNKSRIGKVECVWFDGAERKDDLFPPQALRLLEPGEGEEIDKVADDIPTPEIYTPAPKEDALINY